MTKLSKIYKPFDIVVIPFPFSDQLDQKKRPALVLSSKEFNDGTRHLVTAMITSAKHSAWPFDTNISDLKATKLPVDCLIRMKFFTVDQKLIMGTLGQLSKKDQATFKQNFRDLFGL